MTTAFWITGHVTMHMMSDHRESNFYCFSSLSKVAQKCMWCGVREKNPAKLWEKKQRKIICKIVPKGARLVSDFFSVTFRVYFELLTISSQFWHFWLFPLGDTWRYMMGRGEMGRTMMVWAFLVTQKFIHSSYIEFIVKVCPKIAPFVIYCDNLSNLSD